MLAQTRLAVMFTAYQTSIIGTKQRRRCQNSWRKIHLHLTEGLCNIFVFHGGLDLPNVRPPYIEADILPDELPNGFNYYAAGHIHEQFQGKFKTGTLAYSGCTETADYREAKYQKGFFHVTVNEKGEITSESIALECSRKFIVLEQDFPGLALSKNHRVSRSKR